MKKTVILLISLAVVAAVVLVGVGLRNRSQQEDTAADNTSNATTTEAGTSADDEEAKADSDTEVQKEEKQADADDEGSSSAAANAGDADSGEKDPEERTELVIDGEDSSEKNPVTIEGDNAWTEWDSFLSMSPQEQDAFMQSFESPDAFASWMVAAQAEWAAAHPTEEIGPGDVIDFGG